MPATMTRLTLHCTGTAPLTGGGREVSFNVLPPGTTAAQARNTETMGTIRWSSDNPALLQDFHAGGIYSLEEIGGGDNAGGRAATG